ncbi:hypothetical protein RAJCM14343_1486 [Rhodococcus aetherivorans]|uniref:eCIS core domain-containing protein n=2 Tax=Rhodococcus aetherivorans TaxID=191292 RepID=A0ABQ0YI52_9NOCA|nr:hypothetical protein RAJCM14343_1486 [Rhodococcus aetherivorans]
MEREADAVAARVTSRSSPGGPQPAANDLVQRTVDEDVHRTAEEDVQRTGEEDVQRTAEEEVQRAVDEDAQRREAPGGSAPRITARTARTIAQPGSGSPMPTSVRRTIEPHVDTHLGGVRVHDGADAVHAATSLHARAFTVGNNIFLNRGESPHDVSLMAHESAHVVQQGGALNRSSHIARIPDEAQRLPDLITDELADYARHVPGYTLLTYVIEYDPLRGIRVEPTAMALIEGLMGLVPFGTFVFDQLRELGILDKAFNFVRTQLATFDLSLARLERAIEEAWDEMDFARLDPFDYNLGVLTRHVHRLLDDVRGFASSLLSSVMDLIKDTLLGVAEDLLAENKAWSLIRKILHYDPLRDEAVDASTVEILEDFLTLIGKEQELGQMRVRGTLQKTADWLDTQVGTFKDLLTELTGLFSAAWDAIQPSNLPDLPTTLPALVQRAGAFLRRVWDFATTVAAQVIQLIKDALLGWLASFVDEVPGFHMITVILRKNPFTGEVVPRTAENIIRGFITLIPGGNAIYDRLAETGIIAEAGARIEGAIADLGISWAFIVGLFKGVWDAVVSIETLIDPIGVFTQVRDQFGEPIARLFAFIRIVLQTMFEILLALMNFPTDLVGRIIDNAMQAYEHIKLDPIGFLLNMLAAVKLGFSNFFDNILTHLTAGLVDWLFRGLRSAGIEPPKDLSFASILDIVLQVLGISVERIWEKLAQRFGQETIDRIRGAIDQVVGIWTLVRDISERGISALWEYVESQLSNLWNTVLQAATDWVMEQIVNRVVTKLLSMLDPTGIMAVINGFIAFFNAVQSAIEYLREILEIIDSYVATFTAVAAGDIEPGAARLEGGLAAAIPVAIGFLANQVGLGNIGAKIAEIIGRVREFVNQALDWLINKLAAMVDGVLAMIRGEGTEGAGPDAGSDDFKFHEDIQTGGEHHNVDNKPGSYELVMSSNRASLLSNHPSDDVKAAYKAYLDAVAAATTKTARKKAADKHSAMIVAKIKAAGSPDAPRASAPGLGNVAEHTSQQKRLTKVDIPVWAMESEHVIPRGFLDAALTGTGERGVPASGTEYNQMHTVLIYKGAADEKTEGDAGDTSLWSEINAKIHKASRTVASSPNPSAQLPAFTNKIHDLLNDAFRVARVNTYAAIVVENEKNGAARGPVGKPEPPSPGKSRVDDAYRKQLGDIERIIGRRMQSQL